MDLSELANWRRKARPYISWAVIKMRAYALVAREHPLLRRLYVPLPTPHYYEHPESIAMLAVNREVNGHSRLLIARFTQPENHSLVQLQSKYDDYRRLPLSELKQLRAQVRFSRMPAPLRKFSWHLMTGWMPRGRARMMGTFGMSPSGTRSIDGTWHLGPTTTTLGYDPYCVDGKARVTLTFDHRVLDGLPAATVLQTLGDVLKTQMRNELVMLARTKRPATEVSLRRAA